MLRKLSLAAVAAVSLGAAALAPTSASAHWHGGWHGWGWGGPRLFVGGPAFYGYGYGGGYGGQATADLTFKCKTDYRGYVTDVDVDRVQGNYGYDRNVSPYGNDYSQYGYRRY